MGQTEFSNCWYEEESGPEVLGPRNGEFDEHLSDQRCKSDRFCLKESMEQEKNNNSLNIFSAFLDGESYFFEYNIPSLDDIIADLSEDNFLIQKEDGMHYFSFRYIEAELFASFKKELQGVLGSNLDFLMDIMISLFENISLEDIYTLLSTQYQAIHNVKNQYSLNEENIYTPDIQQKIDEEYCKISSTEEYAKVMERLNSGMGEFVQKFDVSFQKNFGIDDVDNVSDEEWENYHSAVSLESKDFRASRKYKLFSSLFPDMQEEEKGKQYRALKDAGFEFRFSGYTMDVMLSKGSLFSPVSPSHPVYQKYGDDDWALVESSVDYSVDFNEGNIEFIDYPIDEGGGRYVGIKVGDYELVSYLENEFA